MFRRIQYINLIRKNLLLVTCLVFISVHFILLNINYAEWGDSYRILRASTFLRELSYPADEKRPPLYSAFLATWPKGVDPVVWSRVLMLGVSLVFFVVFYKFIEKTKVVKRAYGKIVAAILFTFNPVFLYWSIRIMADVPFALLAFAAFYVLHSYKEKASFSKIFWTGVIAGLSVLTRFEGYILAVSLTFGVLFINGFDFSKLSTFNYYTDALKKRIKLLGTYLFGLLLPVVPFLIWRNPLNSSYLSEPSGRAYDLRMVFIYLLSVLVLFGFTSAVFFAFKKKNTFIEFFQNQPGIFAFVLLEMLVILLWPAAIPRLFTAVIPFLIIPLAGAIESYFFSSKGVLHVFWQRIFSKIPFVNVKVNLSDVLVLLILLLLYMAGQYILKLQFGVVIKEVFVIVIWLQLFMIYAVVKYKFEIFILLLFLSTLLWSMATIYIHKDIYTTTKNAALYATQNLNGVLYHNDIDSVVDWYVNYSPEKRNGLTAVYSPLNEEILSESYLEANNVSSVLATNENNVSLGKSRFVKDHLKEIAYFEHYTNGAEFFSIIFNVIK